MRHLLPNSNEGNSMTEKPVSGGECDGCANRLKRDPDVKGYRCKIKSVGNCREKTKEEKGK